MNEKGILILLSLGGVFVVGLMASREQKKEPNLQQWVNRLIEHIDHIHINEAVKRFGYLVESGMEPGHAFEIVVRS